MAAVPQRTLNWLYSILIRDHYDPKQTYQDPNRAYYDVANVLAQYPSLSPRTDVYTYETGFSTLLLLLGGTIPVSFRGNLYKFPIEVWIPTNYPCEPPMVYVTPTQDMVVRAGQHVTLEGRVYHHYLAHWMEMWDRATLVEFLSILRDVFAVEPPVKYKPQPTPPPVPPLPPGFGGQTPSQTQTPVPGSSPGAPPPPPKQADQPGSPPPLPPLPREEVERRTRYSLGPTPGYPAQHPGLGPRQPGQVPGPAPAHYSAYYSPSSGPVPYQGQPGQAPQAHQAQPGLGPVPTYQGPPGSGPAPQAQPVPAYQGQPGQGRPVQPVQPVQPGPGTAPVQAPAQAPGPAPAPDLLTSPFEVDLPTITTNTNNPPPIPPNPEKHALQATVSQTLSQTLTSHATQSTAAAQALSAQSHSLHAAVSAVQTEITSLNGLNAALLENTDILKESLSRADSVISDAKFRLSTPGSAPVPGSSTAPGTGSGTGTPTPGPGKEGGNPPIDEILVAPTVVGKQLYDLTADEAGIQAAIYALQVALVKGVIGPETWARHTRGLAREAFLKRALGRKVAIGMGLDVT